MDNDVSPFVRLETDSPAETCRTIFLNGAWSILLCQLG